MHWAVTRGWHIEVADVDTAFLNADLPEPTYIAVPQGVKVSPGTSALRLLKALYGLKNSPRCWFEALRQTLIELLGMQQEIAVDPCLGLEVQYDQLNRTAMIRQRRYILEILTATNMLNCKPAPCPQAAGSHNLRKDAPDDPPVDRDHYTRDVGMLGFLAAQTRPDIMSCYQRAARYMNDPRQTHRNYVQRILRYLRGTVDYALTIEASTDDTIVGYSDASHADNLDSRKSTSGSVFFRGTTVISYSTTSQGTVALSSCEAETIAMSEAIMKMMYIRCVCNTLDGAPPPMVLHCDNQGTIAFLNNAASVGRMKHLDIRLKFIQSLVGAIITVKYCPTDENVADLLSKGLALVLHLKHTATLMTQDA